jgi:excinuclease ABC subunit C
LRGDLKKTISELRAEMNTASKKHKYERAGRYRDQIAALTSILEKQKIVSPRRETHDSVGLFVAGSLAAATVFQIREGRLIGTQNFLLDNAKDSSRREILESFIAKYYIEATDVPKDINTGDDSGAELQQLLSKHHNKKIVISYPSRGRKRQLVKLAETNAREYLEKTSQNLARETAIATRALFELKEKLNLSEIPLRIECFDISNVQGTSPTGSMVVFENGRVKKSDYKRFAVKSIDTPNDVAMMREVLTRRFGHTPGADKSWRLPDLLILDGGRAQLNTALRVLKDKKIKIPTIGLAKREEEIYLPKRASTLKLLKTSPALQLLQRIRDEAHRFAITYHRKRRSKAVIA